MIRFLLDGGFAIPSPVILGRIGRDYMAAIEPFIVEREIPVVRFQKGGVNEEIARDTFRLPSEGRFGVVMIGILQARTSAWRGWPDGGPAGHPHFECARQSVFPTTIIRDRDWAPSS